MQEIALTVGKYVIVTLLTQAILKTLNSRLVNKGIKVYLNFLLLQPVLVVILPILAYVFLPNCSLAFIVFYLGVLIDLFYGISKRDIEMHNLSELQRNHGTAITFATFILHWGGIIWGLYNLYVSYF